ncbi:hypothetical protein LRP88_05638 [Fusarium phalaenopsidis]
MALDLSLDKHEQKPDQIGYFNHSEKRRQITHGARVWLALCFIEREIAMGMAKTSRMPPVSSGLQRMQSMNTRFDEWFQHWDALHEDSGYDLSSFQGTSLQYQPSYTMMFLGYATIGRLTNNQSL